MRLVITMYGSLKEAVSTTISLSVNHYISKCQPLDLSVSALHFGLAILIFLWSIRGLAILLFDLMGLIGNSNNWHIPFLRSNSSILKRIQSALLPIEYSL